MVRSRGIAPAVLTLSKPEKIRLPRLLEGVLIGWLQRVDLRRTTASLPATDSNRPVAGVAECRL
jgi:hypothetical protein